MNCPFRHNSVIYNYVQSLAPKKKRERSAKEKALTPKAILSSFWTNRLKLTLVCRYCQKPV